LGGRYITDFLARDLETSFTEAQRVKHRISRVLTNQYRGQDLSPGDAKIAERMTLATNAIVKELGRTFYAFKSWEKKPLSKIYLTGGTAKTAYFAQFLSEQLEVPVEHLSFDNVGMRVSADISRHKEIIPQSLAIGIRAVASTKNTSHINMRRGEFAFVQNYEQLLKAASTAFKVIGFVMALLIVSYVVKYYFYTGQIAKLQEQYTKELEKDFPEVKKKNAGKNLTYYAIRKDAETRYKSGINKAKGSIEEFRLANRESGALRILKEVSEVVPKDVVIDVTLFDFKATTPGNGKLTLRAETDNFASQSTIIDSLKKVSVLTNIVEKSSGAKPGSDGKKIEFTIEANYSAG